MVQFDSMEAAKDAMNGIKGTFIGNSRRIMVSWRDGYSIIYRYVYISSGYSKSCFL